VENKRSSEFSREVFSQCNLGVSGKLVALCKGIQSSWLSKKSTFSVKGQFNYIGKILKENYWGKIQLENEFLIAVFKTVIVNKSYW